MRILLVEEDDQLVALMTTALARAGLEVDSVSNVGDAEASLNMIHYAAVILEPGLADTETLQTDVISARRTAGRKV